MTKMKCIATSLLLISIAVAGCSSPPPPDIVKEAGKKAFWFLDTRDNGIVVANKFDKTINGEHIYFYEFSSKDKETGRKNELASQTIGIVKRGESWYFLK